MKHLQIHLPHFLQRANTAVVVGLFFVSFVITFIFPASAQRKDPYIKQRLEMVKKYCAREGITNRRVLSALQTVPRHEFVNKRFHKQSYNDAALALGYGQTISPPFIVAYMTETIDPQPEDRILEIGTGSGYQAAVLSLLAKDVYSIEIVEQLGRTAKKTLEKLKYNNVHMKVGDGYKGWPEHAPFDKIIVTCSPENVPAPLVEQLKEGGKMIVPIGERYQQIFYLFEKQNGKLVEKKLIPTLFVPMTGLSEKNRRVLPDPARPQIVNGSFEDDSNEDGLADNWHYQRQTALVSEGAPRGTNYLQFENEDSGRLSQILQGMPLDGRKVKTIVLSLRIKVGEIGPGSSPSEKPSLMLHLYDSVRRPVGDIIFGPWTKETDWKYISRTVRIPASAREAIVRIGLNGATGSLSVDDVRLIPK